MAMVLSLARGSWRCRLFDVDDTSARPIEFQSWVERRDGPGFALVDIVDAWPNVAGLNDQVAVAPRHIGVDLGKIRDLPVHVYLLTAPATATFADASPAQLQIHAWLTLEPDE
jgi:hypothetical protein